MSTWLNIVIENHVAFLTWDSDDGLHRLTRAFMTELRSTLTSIEKTGNVQALVLTGSGNKIFSAGADLREVADLADERAAHAFSEMGQNTTVTLAEMAIPTIAWINGPAYGGGIELALACDFRVAASHTVMHYQAGEWGLLPGWGGTQRLPGLIGPARARRMMLAGYPVRAEEATIWGLVDAVVPEGPRDANEELSAWLAAIKKQHPPVVGRLKIALASSHRYHFESERTAFAACFADGTTQARIKAWLQNKSGGDRRASAFPSVPRHTLSESDGEHPGTSSSSGANYG